MNKPDSPKSLQLAELFCTPPPWSLPEEIRRTIFTLIEQIDIEWALRHPDCPRREWDSADDRNCWGRDCFACFSEIPAQQTIGELEDALSFYQVLDGRSTQDGSFAQALDKCRAALDAAETNLEQLLTVGWHQFFAARNTVQAALAPWARLRELLDQGTGDHRATNDIVTREHGLPPHQLRLIVLLGAILGRGALRCFVFSAAGGTIESPGMQVLRMCLPLVNVNVTGAGIEAILAVGTPPEKQEPSCPH